MTKPEVRKASRGEWFLTSDMDTVRTALTGMLNKRRVTQHALAALMGISSTSMFANFINRKQKNLRLDSFINAAESMGFEIVVREPEAGTKRKDRLAELKAERARGSESPPAPTYGDLVAEDDPDRDLKLRMLDGMQDPANRASLENLFRELREADVV